jgi:hypothetical protein
MDFDQILPYLHLGSCPMNVGDVDCLIRQLRITAVLNLQTEEDFVYLDIDWEAMVGYYDELGIELRRVPIIDFNTDDLRRNLRRAVQVLDELIKGGHATYIHCTAGVNRAPTTVIAYLHWVEKRSLEDALNHVGRCHPCDPSILAIASAAEDRDNGR